MHIQEYLLWPKSILIVLRVIANPDRSDAPIQMKPNLSFSLLFQMSIQVVSNMCPTF